MYFQTCLSRAIFNPEKYVDGFFFPQNGTEGVNVSTDYIYRTFPVTKLSKTNGPACVSLQRVNSGFFVCRKYGCLCYGFLETQYLIRRNSTHFFLLTHCLRDGAARMLEQRVILGEVFFYYKCKVMSQEWAITYKQWNLDTMLSIHHDGNLMTPEHTHTQIKVLASKVYISYRIWSVVVVVFSPEWYPFFCLMHKRCLNDKSLPV